MQLLYFRPVELKQKLDKLSSDLNKTQDELNRSLEYNQQLEQRYKLGYHTKRSIQHLYVAYTTTIQRLYNISLQSKRRFVIIASYQSYHSILGFYQFYVLQGLHIEMRLESTIDKSNGKKAQIQTILGAIKYFLSPTNYIIV